jgi:hypothetical protein
MSELLFIAVPIALWFIVMRWVLPRLGFGT